MNPEREQKLLGKAIKAFEDLTGFKADAQPYFVRGAGDPDAILHIQYKNQDIRFYVEIKANLTLETYGAAVAQLDRFREQGLLITRFVPPKIAEQLREMNIPFIDTAGNTYINEPPLYIYVTGRKPITAVQHPARGRLFQQAGIKVLFALLCNPGLEDEPYRKIARVANVALGTVDTMMNNLKHMGNLIDMGTRGRRLVHKEDLLNRWTTAYVEVLRPKLKIDTFTARDPEWLAHIDTHNTNMFWGGEIAADRITHYLKPEIVTIYLEGKIGEFILRNKLKKDPHGNIEILKKYWNFDEDIHTDLVPPLLIYADLIATGDKRNIETARMIYDKELFRFIRED